MRGVVEEGLKERRASKESIQIEQGDEDVMESEDDVPPKQEEEDAGITQDDDDEVVEQSAANTEMINPSGNAADRTMRTDRATFGESTNSKGVGIRFVDDEEIDKIAAEVEERRSNISNGSVSSVIPRPSSPMKRASHSSHRVRVDATVIVDDQRRSLVQQVETAPSMPIPAHAVETRVSQPASHCDQDLIDADPETPFPRIRGEHLERLFFSMPEHNAKTCAVCYRRRDRPHGATPWIKRTMSPSQFEDAAREQNGERKCSVDESERGNTATTGRRRSRPRDRDGSPEDTGDVRRNQGIPPQTVVARVIRELEDDFTHYKRLVSQLK